MYEFVNVRFNMQKEEEKVLFEKLNPRNKGGSIKKVLKQFYLLQDENLFKKAEIKELIREIMDSQDYNIDIKKDKRIISSNESGVIKIKIGGD